MDHQQKGQSEVIDILRLSVIPSSAPPLLSSPFHSISLPFLLLLLLRCSLPISRTVIHLPPLIFYLHLTINTFNPPFHPSPPFPLIILSHPQCPTLFPHPHPHYLHLPLLTRLQRPHHHHHLIHDPLPLTVAHVLQTTSQMKKVQARSFLSARSPVPTAKLSSTSTFQTTMTTHLLPLPTTQITPTMQVLTPHPAHNTL